MSSIKLTVLLLAFALFALKTQTWAQSCSSPSGSDNWKITVDSGMGQIYFESSTSPSASSEGYYNVTGSGWNFSALFFQVRFDAAATVTLVPSPEVVGFFNTSTTSVNHTNITATAATNVYGYNVLNASIYGFNVTFYGSACAGFGYNDSSLEILICPYSNYIYSSNICTAYTSRTPELCNDPTCLYCFGPGSGNCLECEEGYLQPYNYLCLSTCPTGFIVVGYSDGFCQVCPSYPCDCSCTNCVNGVCVSCQSNTFRDPVTSQCVTRCPVGYYGDSNTTHATYQTCLPCDSSCTSCNGSSSSSCFSCSAGYFLQPSSYSCLQSCPLSGYYPNPSTNGCSACASDCASCVGPLNTECLSCNPSYYLQPFSNECQGTCPAGYYQDYSSNVCIACELGCLTCTGSYVCTACKQGFYFYQTNCLRSCPQSYWNDPTTNDCKLCDITCLTCSGSAASCTSCKTGYFLLASTNACGATCPDGYFPNLITLTCDSCDLACATCTGSSNKQCTACNAGYYLQLNSTVCLDSCPTRGWADPSENLCSPCTPPCLTCSSQTCTSCESGYFFNPISSLCGDTCPTGYYKNNNENLCQPCNSACADCTGSNPTDCYNCSTDYYLQPYSTTCLKTCPSEGYWSNPSNNTCSPCSIKCESCIGPEAVQCTSCSDGTYLQPSNQGCNYFCPAGYFPNSTLAACASCDSCSNSTQCTQCSDSQNSAASFALSNGGKIGIIVAFSLLGAVLIVVGVFYLIKARKVKKIMKIRYSGIVELKDIDNPGATV